MKKIVMTGFILVALYACSGSSSDVSVPDNIHINQDLSALFSDHAKVGSKHTFDATRVTCPAGNSVSSYEWTLQRPSGSSAILDDSTSPLASITLDVEGTYTASVDVTCSTTATTSSGSNTVASSQSISDQFSVVSTSGAVNAEAVAIAGISQPGKAGSRSTLDGSRSFDNDGNPLTYSWSLIDAPAGSLSTLQDSDQAIASFTPDLPGTYEFGLIVNDGSVISLPSATYLYVAASGGNAQPVANAGLDQTESVGHVVTLHGLGSHDLDADALTYEWELNFEPSGSNLRATLANTGFDATSAEPTFTPSVEGPYVFRLRVSDGKLASAWDYVAIVVKGATHSTSKLTQLKALGLDSSDAQHLIDNHPTDVDHVLGVASPIFAGVTIADSMFKTTADSGAALFESTVRSKVGDWEDRHKTRFRKIFGRIAFVLNTQRFENAFTSQASLLDATYEGSLAVDPSANINNYTSNIAASTEFPTTYAQFKDDVNAVVNEEIANGESFRFYLSPTTGGTAYGGRDLKLMIEKFGMAGDASADGKTKPWGINQAAALMFHELMHSVGYLHSTMIGNSAEVVLKPNNVPYFVQIIVGYQETDILTSYCGGVVAICTKNIQYGYPNALYTHYFGADK